MDYETFEEFESVLIGLHKSDKYSKKSEAPLISPATYIPDTTSPEVAEHESRL